MPYRLAKDIPSSAGQRREWIKYQLKIRGISLAALGRQHNTSRQAISIALHRPSPRWEHEIATALGMTPAQIWPERYDEETHIPKRTEKKAEARQWRSKE